MNNKACYRSAEVGTRIIDENEHIKVWEFVLEQGEETSLHTHEMEYIFYVQEGSTLQVFDANRNDVGSIQLFADDLRHFKIKNEELVLKSNPSRRVPVTHSAKNIGFNCYREILI